MLKVWGMRNELDYSMEKPTETSRRWGMLQGQVASGQLHEKRKKKKEKRKKKNLVLKRRV